MSATISAAEACVNAQQQRRHECIAPGRCVLPFDVSRAVRSAAGALRGHEGGERRRLWKASRRCVGYGSSLWVALPPLLATHPPPSARGGARSYRPPLGGMAVTPSPLCHLAPLACRPLHPAVARSNPGCAGLRAACQLVPDELSAGVATLEQLAIDGNLDGAAEAAEAVVARAVAEAAAARQSVVCVLAPTAAEGSAAQGALVSQGFGRVSVVSGRITVETGGGAVDLTQALRRRRSETTVEEADAMSAAVLDALPGGAAASDASIAPAVMALVMGGEEEEEEAAAAKAAEEDAAIEAAVNEAAEAEAAAARDASDEESARAAREAEWDVDRSEASKAPAREDGDTTEDKPTTEGADGQRGATIDAAGSTEGVGADDSEDSAAESESLPGASADSAAESESLPGASAESESLPGASAESESLPGASAEDIARLKRMFGGDLQ